jgi:peptide/nickel transport system substrate-binding protein
VLDRFADYGGANSHYARRPQWDRITLLPITDDSAAETAIDSGDIDFGAIPTTGVDRFAHSSRFNLFRRPTLNYAWMAMSVKDPNLKDINLRRAIRSAIDVPGIIEAAYDGKWERAYAIIPKSMGLGYWANAPHHDRNLDQARAYMKKTGQKSLDLTLTILDQDPFRTAAQVIQSNLSDIGIKVNIVPQDSATYYAIPGNGGGGPHRQLVYAFYVTEPDPSWSFVWFTCSQLKEWNWDDLCLKPFDNLYQQALRTFDPAVRNRLYIQMQKLWDAQASMVWIAYPTDYYAAKKGLRPSIRPDGYLYLWDFRSA